MQLRGRAQNETFASATAPFHVWIEAYRGHTPGRPCAAGVARTVRRGRDDGRLTVRRSFASRDAER